MKAIIDEPRRSKFGVPGKSRMADFDTEKDLIIATTAARVLVRIQPDGTVIYGPEYTPDEAASVFWETLARKRAEAEREARVKELLFRHMETLLVAAGEADLANQAARDRENEVVVDPKATKQDKMKAHLEAKAAEEELNQAAIRLVELGRKLALRGAKDPVSDPPPGTALN